MQILFGFFSSFSGSLSRSSLPTLLSFCYTSSHSSSLPTGTSLFNSLCVMAYNGLLFFPIVTFILDKDVSVGAASLFFAPALLFGPRPAHFARQRRSLACGLGSHDRLMWPRRTPSYIQCVPAISTSTPAPSSGGSCAACIRPSWSFAVSSQVCAQLLLCQFRRARLVKLPLCPPLHPASIGSQEKISPDGMGRPQDYHVMGAAFAVDAGGWGGVA